MTTATATATVTIARQPLALLVRKAARSSFPGIAVNIRPHGKIGRATFSHGDLIVAANIDPHPFTHGHTISCEIDSGQLHTVIPTRGTTVELTFNSGQVTINGVHLAATVNDHNDQPYGSLDAIGWNSVASLTADLFRRIATAAATNDHRHILETVNVSGTNDGTVSWAATDSYRLSWTTVPGTFNDNINLDGVDLLRKLIGGGKRPKCDHVNVIGNGSRYGWKVNREGTTIVHNRTVEGTYPDWRNLLPNDNNRTTIDLSTANLDNLTAWLKRAAKLDKTTPPVVVDFTNPNRVTLSCEHDGITLPNYTINVNQETSTIGHRNPPATEPIAFNPTYLTDALVNSGPTFTIADTLKPALFTHGAVSTLLMTVRP